MAILESHTQTGISWFGESLALFKQSPRKGLLFALPFLGALIFFPAILLFWWPIFTVFAIRAYRNTELGKSERLASTMQLIRPVVGKLLVLGLINIIYLMLVSVILRDELLVIVEMMNQQQELTQAELDAAGQEMMPVFLKMVALFIPLMVAVCFAPMLIAFNEYSLLKSIKSSIAACIQYFVALTAGWVLLSGSVILLFMVAGLIVGMFVFFMPSMMMSLTSAVMFGCVLVAIAISLAFQYVSYRDIYRAA